MSEIEDDEFGGESVCWIDQVCPECGALVGPPRGAPCWRCGAVPEVD